MPKRLHIIAALVALSHTLYAQEDLVDLFTGDFRYTIPVMYIPSIDGPGVPINVEYKSGIAVHQRASWVGLGWGLDVGEIRRDVKGAPDDWTAISKTSNVYDKSGSSWNHNTTESSTRELYGPLYFKNFGTRTTNKEMDVYTSTSSGEAFSYPDFDNYSVSVPGVVGVFQPMILDIGSMVRKDDQSGNNTLKFDAAGAAPGQNLERPMTLFGDNYNVAPTDLGAQNRCKAFASHKPVAFRYMNEYGSIKPSSESGNTYQTGATLEEVTINATQKYYNPIGSRHIVYYTKQDYINGVDGLIKYSGFNPNAAHVSATDIVAFKITNESGFTYHFALPVYMKDEKDISIEMDYFTIGNAKRIRVTNTSKFIVSWKLTAVTGPDFTDSGTTANAIDSGDKGYWVRYTYGQWATDLKWQTPYYDGNRHFGEDADAIQQYRESYPHAKGSTNSYWGEYQDQSNISKGTAEVFYLDKIETSTHTAFFVKDIRYDEHSKKQTTTEKPIPGLLLKRIILLNNADASVFTSTTALATTGTNLFTIPTASTGMIHESKYQANKANIDAKTVSAVEFTYDHSLCKNYAGNINNNLTVTSTTFSFVNTADNFTFEAYPSAPAAGPANSGKLTLLSVVPYGIAAATNQTPPYAFQYSALNPDFHPFKRDFWGYYLKDWSTTRPAEYQSDGSISDIAAWHLTKIATPMGGVVEVEYESDKYTKISGYDRRITRIFGGKFSYQTGNPVGPEKFLLDDSGLYDLLNSTNGVGRISLGYPCQCVWSQSYYFPPTQSWGNFIESVNTTLKKKVFNSKDDVTFALVNNKTQITPLTGFQFGLGAFCGEGPSPISGPPSGVSTSNEDINKAIATIDLNYAYGGGLRVKNIYFRETDANGAALAYQREYLYYNGVASQEPGRFTPPAFSRRPTMRDLYDRHTIPPAVGYSRIEVKEKGANGQYTDHYSEFTFNNYDDWRYGSPGLAIGVFDETYMDPYTNWDVYFNCLNLHPSDPASCDGLQPFDYTFQINCLDQTGRATAMDRSRRFVGKMVASKTYDKNGRLLSSSEMEYKKVATSTTAFHQKTHQMIPVSYDRDFLYYGNAAYQNNLTLRGFGPFTSPNATGHSTLLNSSVYFRKTIETDILERTISAKNDVRTVTTFLDFDPLTGIARKTESKDPSTGELLEKEMEFAFNNPTYAVFGPKAKYNSGYKNLLTYVSLEKLKKGGVLVGGTRREFANIRKVRAWNSGTSTFTSTDQTIPWTVSKTFVFDGDQNPVDWKEDMEYTLFNSKGNILEQKAYVNATTSRYSMTKLGYNNRFVITEATDSKYTESTYSGAEDTGEASNYFSGEVKTSISSAVVNTNLTYVHTGKQSLQLNPGGQGFEYKIPCTELNKDRTYLGRVWAYRSGNTTLRLYYEFRHNSTNAVGASGNVTISTTDGANGAGYVTVGNNWALLTARIAVNSGMGDVYTNFGNYTLTVRCDNFGAQVGYVDDFRFHPISSTMTNYVFNTFTGLPEFMLDGNGFYTRYEYDGLGRVYRQFVETPAGERQVTEVNRNFYRFSTANPF